jgi:hypothetical protein
MESWGMENSSNTESRVTHNSSNTKSWVMESLAKIGNQFMQDSGGRKPEEGTGAAPSKRPVPWWCPRGISKTQKCRLQKMHQRELAKKKGEEQQDY